MRKRIAIICALVYLIIAIAADFFAISFRSSRQKAELQHFYLVEQRLEQIAQEKESSEELRQAVVDLRMIQKGRNANNAISILAVWISIGACFISFGALLYHWKNELS